MSQTAQKHPEVVSLRTSLHSTHLTLINEAEPSFSFYPFFVSILLKRGSGTGASL